MSELRDREEAQRGEIPTFKNIVVVVNPVSGLDNGVSPIDTIRRTLESAGMRFEIRVTQQRGDAMRFAQEAVKSGADVVGVYGGDGTVMEVARGLMETHVPMAIFPGGTANVMSVELGISQDLSAAIALIMGSEYNIRSVDMASLNKDQYFLLRLGIGLEAEMTLTVEREEKRRLGRLAYIRQALRAINNPRVATYRLTLDGKRHIRRRGVSCMICNSANIGLPGVSIAPDVSISDGWLDVIVIPGTDLRSLLGVMFSTLKSVIPVGRERKTLAQWKAREVTVAVSRRKQMIGLDGEEVNPKFPLQIRILPAVLKVAVPGVPHAADQKTAIHATH